MAKDKSYQIKAVSARRRENEDLYARYMEEAMEKGIPTDLTSFPAVPPEELKRRRRDKRHVRAYMTQLFNNMLKAPALPNIAYLFIDEDGVTVKINCTDELERWFCSKSLDLGSRWQMDVLGPNAVTIGLRDRVCFSTVGRENYHPLLQDMAIYFAPMEVGSEGHNAWFGGLALVTPAEIADEAIMLLAVEAAYTCMVRMNMAWNTSDAYEADSKGTALFDVNTKTGKVYLTHHNYGFFDILGIQRMSLRESYFHDVEEYIDPLPANEEFWEIVRSLQQVTDREISLQVQGTKRDVILTSFNKQDPELESKGILFSFTNRRMLARQTSDKMGNNAVLSFDDVIGNSRIMQSRIKRARMLARTDSNILILGESGVGKDVFAQAIHNGSGRRNGPFVAVNCGAIPRDLIASELFGYEGGAFTGARKQGNIGKFELADGGTLFLDEIGEMPLDLQATLLRAVEQKQFMRLGSSKTVSVDVRIISATNVDIMGMIEEKRFRADLYYRLCTMNLQLPPLRERGDDIVLLAEYFIGRVSRKIRRFETMKMTPEVRDFLKTCSWKGNVRELQNVMECIVQLYEEPAITMEILAENINPLYLQGKDIGAGREEEEVFDGGSLAGRPDEEAASMAHPIMTKLEILAALEKCGGNRSKAAKRLGVGRRTLYRYIDMYGIGKKSDLEEE